MTRRTPRLPVPNEIWSERTPRRAGRPARTVLIEEIVDKNGVECVRVRNVVTGRRSRIPRRDFTIGVVAGWYRRSGPISDFAASRTPNDDSS